MTTPSATQSQACPSGAQQPATAAKQIVRVAIIEEIEFDAGLDRVTILRMLNEGIRIMPRNVSRTTGFDVTLLGEVAL